LTQKAYEIWWYEQGCGKPRWNAQIISIDTIHAQVEEKGKLDKEGLLEASQPL
jgi:hypothetical protein